MNNFLSMSYFIPKPTITEQNCPDQRGRVFIVTGGYAGIGYELSKILYSHHATVYMAGRSEAKATKAISRITQEISNRSGKLEFLKLDLADLTTIKPAVQAFLDKETRLDVLVNNAGVYTPQAPQCHEKTAQGHDIQIGTNCLGPLLLYKLLEETLLTTATVQAPGSTRVLWASSVVTEVNSPPGGGMKLDRDGAPIIQGDSGTKVYGQSKVGCAFYSAELARTAPMSGIVHLAFNPGNVRSELQRNWTGVGATVTDWTLLSPAINGAYTELWAAVSPDVTLARSGQYVWPWGRWGPLRRDIEGMGIKPQVDGGLGLATRFLTWSKKEIESYM